MIIEDHLSHSSIDTIRCTRVLSVKTFHGGIWRVFYCSFSFAKPTDPCMRWKLEEWHCIAGGVGESLIIGRFVTSRRRGSFLYIYLHLYTTFAGFTLGLQGHKLKKSER